MKSKNTKMFYNYAFLYEFSSFNDGEPTLQPTQYLLFCFSFYTPEGDVGFLDLCEPPPPKRHLDRFSRFYTSHHAQHRHTDRYADHATCDSGSNRPHLCSACSRCGLVIITILCRLLIVRTEYTHDSLAIHNF